MGKRILATEAVVCVIVLVLVVAVFTLAWLQPREVEYLGRSGTYWRRGNILSDYNRDRYSNRGSLDGGL